ncbi:hypothetical protein BDFB_001621 [Asbolus verrucosus]|uniref:Uncharacterized protein n=1 Tax=Asbolus verrucosus TaxID=1661398 RepID=A0A482VT38_ASBVE|nr:hypothetical protein BDFB_001621 [Asbolus verrucosus]
MSDLDDLLNGEDEFDYEDNEITNEEEEALLQDEDFDGARFPEDEYLESKRVHDSTKKESASETDEPEEDILNLDIEGEEDFQEVEDKAAYDEQTNENRKDGKFSVERAPAAPKMTTTVKVERAQVAKPAEDDTDKDKVQNIKKVPPKIDKRRRGNGRNNFQTRPNFIRNNDRRQERRNSTVFINPKYEGIVHVNDNNARLAWDSTTFPQNRYIQPWVSGNIPRNCDLNFQSGSSLITNLVSELATNISQTSNLFQIPTVPQSQNQNFFQPPPDVYHPPVSFQPPNVQGAQQPYSNQNQHIPHWDDTYNMLNQNQYATL